MTIHETIRRWQKEEKLSQLMTKVGDVLDHYDDLSPKDRPVKPIIMSRQLMDELRALNEARLQDMRAESSLIEDLQTEQQEAVTLIVRLVHLCWPSESMVPAGALDWLEKKGLLTAESKAWATARTTSQLMSAARFARSLGRVVAGALHCSEHSNELKWGAIPGVPDGYGFYFGNEFVGNDLWHAWENVAILKGLEFPEGKIVPLDIEEIQKLTESPQWQQAVADVTSADSEYRQQQAEEEQNRRRLEYLTAHMLLGRDESGNLCWMIPDLRAGVNRNRFVELDAAIDRENH